MSNYNKITNFTVKDSLPSGEPDKTILGGEIDDELDAISTAIATKLDTATSVGEKLWPTSTTETDAGIVPANLRYSYGNIRRYGAVVNGVTDDSAAVRKALDLAAADGTTVTCDPPGSIKISSTVYIPQRAGIAQRGFLMSFYGSTFIGQGRGTGTIFESGMGSTSTGGVTNFGQPDETVLHYGTKIYGAQFKECGSAIRLFNFILGTKAKDLYFEDVDQAMLTDRCFYMGVENCKAQVTTIDAADVLFDFTDTNNAMVITGCTAAGGGANTTGTGFRIFGGGAGSGGMIFHGNTAEKVARGLLIGSAVEGVSIDGNYFEACSVAAIDASAGGSKSMSIDNNWFYVTTKAIDATAWQRGKWGAGNYFAGTPDTVEIDDVDSTCIVEIPNQFYSEAQSLTATRLPGNFDLGPGVTVAAPRSVYVASTGTSAILAVDSTGGSFSVPAFAYSGGSSANGATFSVPFVTQTLNVGSSILDTQIVWNDYHMHVYYGLYTEIAGAKNLSGIVGTQGTVRALDGSSVLSVAASNNGGFLRLTVTGSAHTGVTAAGFWGQIRHL